MMMKTRMRPEDLHRPYTSALFFLFGIVCTLNLISSVDAGGGGGGHWNAGISRNGDGSMVALVISICSSVIISLMM